MKIYRSKVYDSDIENINIKLSIDNENSCFWDNLDFFIYNNKKTIKKECKQELIDKNLYVKEIFDIIKKLTNTAILENMLIRTYKND